MRILAACFASVALAIGCGGDNSQNYGEDIIRQEVLFHFSYINTAWGYQNQGWFIDSSGAIIAYAIADSSRWYFAADSGPDSGYISRDALLANYARADWPIYKIQYPALVEKYNLINPSAFGRYSALLSEGADIGAIQYFCYFWDYHRGRFKQVLLSLSGDFSRTNLAPEAAALDRWLKELNEIYEDSLHSR